jgi:hypothetical protein
MKEHFFQCPYCWETISMLVDTSVSSQSYIEDCEVCCRPINISVQSQNDDIVSFEAEGIQ